MFTYGPIPSRRLGRSLGVSIIPGKVCSYSCVYCQLGPTKAPRIKPVSYFDPDAILAEIAVKLTKSTPDCITFVGDGEPTLSSDLGWCIQQCKARWPVPVAVITNGSLLYRKKTRCDLRNADIVLPSLDAGDGDTYEAINRPHPALDFEKVVQGLIEFRSVFRNQLRLEVMLVKGINDTEKSIRSIRKLVWAIRPDRVDIAIPTRPPAESWVVAPDPEAILRAQRLLHAAETMTRPECGSFEFAGFGTVLESVIGLSARHPLRWDQAKQVEAAFDRPGELERLVSTGALAVIEYRNTRFVAPPSRKQERP